MSNIYNLEPPTKGKVVLHTTMGDLDIELFAKEAPKAVRNFVQLCMEGYYDNTIFHRVIRDYMAQGGDPTGSGDTGESVYGELFRDEFHQRLKFSRRGLVACANQNAPHTNGSQFFVTLDKCDWLDRKNTIFGKVVGDTIFNLARMNEIDTDPETDRPYDPAPKIISTEVLWNPFDDIVPRVDREAERRKAEEEAERAAAEAARKTKAAASKGRNLALLSFGDDEEEGEEAVVAAPRRIRAAHDVLQDDRLVRGEDTPVEERITVEPYARATKKPRTAEEEAADDSAAAQALARTRAVLAGKLGSGKAKKGEEEGEEGDDGRDGRDFDAHMRSKMMDQRLRMGDVDEAKEAERAAARAVRAGSEGAGREGAEEGGGDEGEREEVGGARGARSAKEAAASRREELEETRREKRAFGKVQAGAVEVVDGELLKPWQLSREKYKQRKRVIGGREAATLQRLKAFQDKLHSQNGEEAGAGRSMEGGEGDSAGSDQGGAKEDDKGYAGKVDAKLDHRAYMPAAWRVDDYLEGDWKDASLEDLKTHTLSFATASGRTDNMSRRDNIDDYVVFDPLLEEKKGKFSKAAQAEKKRQSEWAGRSNV